MMGVIQITITEDGAAPVVLSMPAEVSESLDRFISAEITLKWEVASGAPIAKNVPRWGSKFEFLAARLRDVLKPILERFPIVVESAQALEQQRADIDRLITEEKAKAVPDILVVAVKKDKA